MDLLQLLPMNKVRIIHNRAAVCVSINKLPVRSSGEVMIDFSMGNPARQFRAKFLVIESLIHPIVLGLPFLREQRGIISFEHDAVFFGDCMTPLWQTPPPPKPPPLHVAAFESVTIPAWSRSLIPVYLTGTGRLEEEMNKVQNFYIRPFASETSVDVPQIAAHAIIDSSKPISMVEVMNVWPNPINITKDMPVGLVDTINPEIAELPNGVEKRQAEASLEPRTLPPDRETDSHMLATPTDLEALTDPPTGADLSAIQGDLSDTRTRCGPPLGIHNTDPDITSPKAVRLARRPQVTETVQTEEKSEVDEQWPDCPIHAFTL